MDLVDFFNRLVGVTYNAYTGASWCAQEDSIHVVTIDILPSDSYLTFFNDLDLSRYERPDTANFGFPH